MGLIGKNPIIIIEGTAGIFIICICIYNISGWMYIKLKNLIVESMAKANKNLI